MPKRPTPHVDNTATQADAQFVPTLKPATAATDHVKVAIHGDNGVGKTYFAGTFPKPIILALDPGHAVLRQLPGADDILVARIPDATRGDRAPLVQLWDYVTWLQRGEHDRETVVLDSVTELHKMILEAVMRQPRQRESATIPSTDDYVEVNAKLVTLLRHVRDLPMHAVFTGHHKILKKKDDVIGVRFDLSEKVSTALGGMCDVVMHATVREAVNPNTDAREIVYMGQTVPMNGVQAKDRSGKLRTPYTRLGWEYVAEAFGIVEAPEPPPAAKPKAKAKAKPAPEPEPEAPVEEPEAPSPAPPDCEACNGIGVVPEMVDGEMSDVPCTACDGKGVSA